MKLFWGLFGVMIMMRVMALPAVAGTNKVAEMQLNFWREKLPSVQVPETVAASMSPLTQEEVKTFAKIIKDGNLRSHATQFCNSANLLCSQSVDVISAPTIEYFPCQPAYGLDGTSGAFFSPKELREGGQITLPDLYSPSQAFLPRNLSHLIPFSTVELSDVASSFGMLWSSNMTQNMNSTLVACEDKPRQGEIKRCITSIEGMIEFVLSNLGSPDTLELLLHPELTRDSGKKARVTKVVQRPFGPSNRPPLACHRFVYPYAVFYCHSINGTLTFKMEVEVLKKNGNMYNATGLCHPDVRSKGSVFCHLILGGSMLWLTKDEH